MSACGRSIAPRRRLAAIAASTSAIAAAAPALLHHTGRADWSDGLLGGIVGFAVGLSIMLLTVTLLKARRA